MTELTRRAFIKTGISAGVVAGAAVGGGLVVGCGASRHAPYSAQRVQTPGADFDAWLQITPDDRIILYSDKVEMGQGTFTGFATLIAEELEVDPARIEVVHAGVEETFRPMQSTGGSNSMSQRFVGLRESGARAREMLKQAAAEAWGVDRHEIIAAEGELSHPASQRRGRYGEFATSAARFPVPKDVALKSPRDFERIGRERPRVDGAAKARGTAQYGMDIKLPGLRTAVIVRPPYRGARVSGWDGAKALAMPGVSAVFEVPSGIAVVADNYWRCRNAAAALTIEFDSVHEAALDSTLIRSEHERRLAEDPGRARRDDGNSQRAIERAAKQAQSSDASGPDDGQILDVVYHTPYQAHATMEPMNCTIAPGKTGYDVYIGTQTPGIVQDVVADVLDCRRDAVRVHTVYLGGGFGRRFFSDVAVEAAEVAKRAGVPIKLVWSREDDMANDYYRPATSHRFIGRVDRGGTATVWDHRLIAASLIGDMAPRMAGALGPEWLRGALNAVGERVARWIPQIMGPVLAHEGATNHPYAIENVRVSSQLWDPGVRIGIWRSVAHSNNGFVVESFIDELAHAAGRDPAEFRRALLQQHPRHLACLDLVVRKSRWGQPAEGCAQGIAVYESFNTVVAQVAEVRVEDDQLRVERVTCAVDCGLAINPDVVRSQIEGGVIFGLSAALKGAITFKAGAPMQSNFHDYALMRMSDAPDIAVHIVPSEEAPSGVGEPGTPPIAAAVANAVFAATGKRLRELPLRL